MLDFKSVGRSRGNRTLLRLFSVFLIVSLLVIPAGAMAAPEEAPANAPLASKMIFFASDGMRPDLVISMPPKVSCPP